MFSPASEIDSSNTQPLFSNHLRPSPGRRTPSFSSSNSLSSTWSLEFASFPDDSPLFSPITTHPYSGIPFSWEKLPGIPKKQLSMKFRDPSLNLLPLPPAGTPTPSKNPNRRRKYAGSESFRKDPFFAALIQCSKDGDDTAKITRSLSDRFGLGFGFVGMYGSCKRSCSVSESLIYIPSSRKHYMFNDRSC